LQENGLSDHLGISLNLDIANEAKINETRDLVLPWLSIRCITYECPEHRKTLASIDRIETQK